MDVRLDREALLGTRDALISRGLLDTPHLADDVRDPILRSWRRCVSASTPLERLRTRRIEHPSPSQLLGRAAAPVMDRLRDELADLGVAVLLSNRSGRIIARRVADSLQRDRLDDHYVLEGFDYSEQTVGTNGLGTSLAEKQPVWVHGAEHFNDALHVFACVGVPILSSRGGAVAGSLSLAATAAASNPMMMALTKLAARQVEQALGELVRARETALVTAFSRRSGAHRGPSMLLTEDCVLTDTALLPLISPSSHVTLWDAAQQHAWNDATATLTLTLDGLAVVVGVRRLEDSDGPAYLIEFPGGPTSPARRGVAPAIAERGRPEKAVHPVAEVERRLLAAARTTDTIVLRGGPGSGRLSTASRLALKQGRQTLVLDASAFTDEPLHDWWASADRAVSDGQCVVIRHCEQLTDIAIGALESLRPDGHAAGDPRPGLVIACIDPERVPRAVNDRLERLGIGIDLPRLADMPDQIPDLVHDLLSDRLLTAGCPSRMSSSALQALRRWSWPGNLRELRTVVLGAAAVARGPVIGPDDLPARIVEAHRSASMSGIERAERSAIVAALAKNGGNRSHAALDLGIGRTTLYRKMRELKITDADVLE